MAPAPAKPIFTAGVDIGGTKIYSVILDENNRILGRGKKKTSDGTPPTVLTKIQASIGDALQEAGLSLSQLAGIGLGFPGPLDPHRGIILDVTNLVPEWKGFHLADEMTRLFGVPSFIDNDVNLGTLGEALAGAGQGAANVIGIFLGTGVGGGIVIGGKLYHGTSGTAGEVGHMIIQHGGPPSPRNLHGSVEGLTSRNALIRMIKREIKKGKKSMLTELFKGDKKIGSSKLAEAYQMKDPAVRSAFAKTAVFVGVTVASLINFLAPDVVVLGGGVIAAAPDAIIPVARKVASKIVVDGAWQAVRIEAAALGDDAGAVGGALLARQKLSESGN